MITKNQYVYQKINEFYNLNPFPDFDINKYASYEDLRDQGSWFYKLLDFYIPIDKNIVDVGCGTGQFACFFANKGRKVLGVDFSENSLIKANFLKKKLNIHSVKFLKKDLLNLALPEENFDYTFCCGVLHHTADPYLGFKNLVKITRGGGFIILGLYNRYGRIFLKFRRFLVERFLKTDQKIKDCFINKQLATLENDRAKIDSWYADQYKNPYELTHTIGEILKWFHKNGISYINSFPSIELFKTSSYSDFVRFQPDLFVKQNYSYLQLCSLAFFLKQLKWIITLNDAGGYFVIIGQKQDKRSNL